MRRRLIPILVLVLGVAGLTSFHARTVDLGPFQGSLAGAEVRYWETASQVRTGGWNADAGESGVSPIYSLFLAPLTSEALGAVRHARRILVAVLVPLFALISVVLVWPRAGPWVAVGAGIATASAAPVALAASTVAPGPLAVVLVLLALLVFGRSPGILSGIGAGFLIALAGRFHPLVAWSVLLMLLGELLLRRENRTRARRAALALAGAWVVTLLGTGRLSPAEPVIPAVHGIDLYRGHRESASGVNPRRGDRDRERWWLPTDYLREASRAKGYQISPTSGDAYWGTRALSEAVTHPVAEARRIAVKTLATFQGDMIPRSVSTAFLVEGAETPWPLDMLVWIGRILVPLGLAGLVLARRSGSDRLLVGAAAGLLGGWIIYPDADTQLLSVVCSLSGIGFLARHLLRSRGPARVTGSLVAGGAMLVWTLLPAAGAVPGQGILGEDHFQLGTLYDRDGRGSAAMREFERALRLEPENPYPRLAIAGTFARDNVRTEAIAELERLRENHPDFMPGLLSLTRLYQEEKRYVEAAATYAELMRIEPWNVEHLNNLGTMYVQVGYFDQAVRAFEGALAIDPEYAIARDNLASLRERGLAPGAPPGADSLRIVQEEILTRIRAGSPAAAESALAVAYGRFGSESGELQFLEGTLRLLQGTPQAAIPLLETARGKLGPTVPVISNLGTAYAHAGRFAEAKQQFQEALRLQPSNIQVQKSLARVEAALDSLAREGGG